ncbi:MAG: hypothetical protein A2677_00710 [Candidatus Komeilibacteria bacterium RIFCSPHIGHO2_01_FULL_52_14]|uniref:VTT domain-containing protein n=1 Tax=Candidatus Komeilibacteria bacterium RIFCSPHIGHO2_01_FULL_52_14 TaxID=1798549 RepID=A0A1G2BJU8_9BACT|nr:MAG: hypothetical protein A2677_00710 [Candidatus Komeilibacteria bacterium RIFCSPHIGHO2_01_FULL_52_14]
MFDLTSIIQTIGYVGATAVIFAETGLFFGFFLPGDSLLFTAGFLASQGYFNIAALIALFFTAAVVGDSVGYWFGRRVGDWILSPRRPRFIKQEYIDKTKKYFAQYGGKTIVLARFIPIVRTFAPILAGVGSMPYRAFLSYNIIGAVIWAIGIPLLGYYLGRVLPDPDKYLLPIVLVIVLTSFLPAIIEVIRSRSRSVREDQKQAASDITKEGS